MAIHRHHRLWVSMAGRSAAGVRWAAITSMRGFATTAARRKIETDFDTVIIGGGVVGLAIAYSLVARPSFRSSPSTTTTASPSVLLLERHPQLGTETSSRNSEVIHSGLYYPPKSLKTRLCMRGRQLLYPFCEKHGIGCKKSGKWIVAQDAGQTEELKRMVRKLEVLRRQIGKEGGGEEGGVVGDGGNGKRGGGSKEEDKGTLVPPLRWVSQAEATNSEPDIFVDWKNGGSILESPETGIVDSHALMLTLEGLFTEAGGTVAFNSPVGKIAPLPSSSSASMGDAFPGRDGWEITINPASSSSRSKDSGNDGEDGEETTTITTRTVINSAGLSAADLANTVLLSPEFVSSPPYRPYHLRYAKGNYFSYASSRPKPNRLIYPAPVPGLGGLGTHLTLDLAGRVRFGPDVEWLSDPEDNYPRADSDTGSGAETRPGAAGKLAATEAAAHGRNLDLSVSSARLTPAIREIKKYLPSIDETELVPDYCGIRPKLVPPPEDDTVKDGGFVDFLIRHEPGFDGWINLLGIESPGLTSSLAIGEMVAEMVYSDSAGDDTRAADNAGNEPKREVKGDEGENEKKK